MPTFIGAYILKDDIDRFGTGDRDKVIGEVHCIGTEPELLEYSHASIGFHYCSSFYNEPDIVISCYGMTNMHQCIMYIIYHTPSATV